MTVPINSIFKTEKDEVVRILYFDTFNQVYFVIDINKKRWPFAIDDNYLEGKTVIKKYEVRDNLVDGILLSEGDLTESQKTKRDFAWIVIQNFHNIIEETRLTFYSKYRQKAINKTAKHHGISESTVKNYLLRYWKNGMTLDAMIPEYYNSGGRGKERRSNSTKLGRPRSDGSKGVNIDGSIKKKFKMGLNRHYYTDKQNSLKTAYELTLKDFFTEKNKDPHGRDIYLLKNPSDIPTYNQFKYWFGKNNDPKKEVSTRYGTRVYYQKHRGITGDSTQDAGLGPGTLWQTDSTPLDVYCVSTTNRNSIVGKPLLHLVIDVYSRVIVGFSLSFESLNAYSGSMNALYNSMTSKQLLCERYQIDVGDQWDIACVPQRIFTDRGELESTQIENAIEHLGISVQNAQSYRPETKAIIETAFLQMMNRIIPHVDGAVVSGNRVKERGEKDYRLKANLTIYELTQILIKCILFYNNHHVIKDYVLDEGMLEVGIEKIPMQLWNYGVNHAKGSLRTLPDDYIKMHLLEAGDALVTARGLKFKKMLYINRYSLKNNWFEKAREKTWKEKVWFDPTNLSSIYVIHPETQKFMEMKLLDHLTKFENKNIVEIDSMIKEENHQVRKASERELTEKMKLFQEIEQIVESGKAQTEKEANPTLSKSERLKGIRDNQREERELQREWQSEVSINKGDKLNVEEFESRDELDLFRIVRDTRRNKS